MRNYLEYYLEYCIERFSFYLESFKRSWLYKIPKAYLDLLLITCGFVEQAKQAIERKKICNKCTYKKKVIGVGVCGECSCVISAIVNVQYKQCDKKKWRD